MFSISDHFLIFGGPGGSMSQVVGSTSSYKPITNTAWVRAQFCKLQKRCTRLAAASDKVYQLLAQGRWFSPGTPASPTTKTGRHDVAEILLKVALNTKIHSNSYYSCYILTDTLQRTRSESNISTIHIYFFVNVNSRFSYYIFVCYRYRFCLFLRF